jgi:hypothetical protein
MRVLTNLMVPSLLCFLACDDAAAVGNGSAPSGGAAAAGGVSTAGTGASAGTRYTPSGTIIEPGSPTGADVTFEIRSDRDYHAISPLIYGLNSTDEIATTGQSVVRSGGNRLTAYNWENNASNAGSDWQFQNDDYLVMDAANPDAPGEAVRGLIQTSHQNGAAALLTVPNVDYVAADKDGGGDVRNSGADYLSTRFKRNQASQGAAFSLTPDTADDVVYQDEFVNWVKTTFATGGALFDLDNEPDVWSGTHAEIHPNPVTYAELVERNARFATAIKDTWLEAKTLGFVSYGWSGYVNLQDASDANGDFINYYLDQMRAAESTAGRRLVDYLDLHWYPEARGGADADANGGVRITEQDSSAAVVEARVQAPRSLWDASYTENSWITRWSTNGPIRLIPLIKEKIAAHYPGTELAFSEWNFGGGTHVSGALASADALGIFGREGVGLACNWGFGAEQTYMRAAFRVYRNFDGNGGHFGDTSIAASTSDVVASSVYASLMATAPGEVVIVAINQRASALRAAFRVAHTTAYSRADVYTLTSSGPQVTPAAPITAAATNAFLLNLPAQSVSVVVPKP